MRLPRRTRMLVSLAVTGSSLGSVAPLAHAQDTRGSAKVAAETLFEEGRRLMGEGKAAEACPKFAESQRLDPSPGTLLNLASCDEKTDRPATAWATYREAASAALAAGRQDLVATAQRHADTLFSAMPRVSVTVATPVDGLVVKLDGVEVGRAEWDVALPVDPGEHTLEASAPQWKPWSTKLTIGHDATTTPVTVPALEAAPAPTPAAVIAPPVPAAAPPAAAPAAEDDTGRSQRTAGLLVGAGGIVGLGLGAAFAAIAKSEYSDSLANCSSADPNRCSQAGVDERGSARTSGDIASVALAVGGAAVVGGVILWVVAPSPGSRGTQSAAVALVPTLGGAMVSGRW
jgi:hypothetical protein